MIKRKITVLMLCGILCITGCSQNRKAGDEKGSTFAQEGMTEAATSVVDFNEYDALFSNAKDTNIYNYVQLKEYEFLIKDEATINK